MMRNGEKNDHFFFNVVFSFILKFLKAMMTSGMAAKASHYNFRTFQSSSSNLSVFSKNFFSIFLYQQQFILFI